MAVELFQAPDGCRLEVQIYLPAKRHRHRVYCARRDTWVDVGALQSFCRQNATNYRMVAGARGHFFTSGFNRFWQDPLLDLNQE